MTEDFKKELESFIREMGRFRSQAEQTLDLIEKDLSHSQPHFAIFSEQMIAIRGMALQLKLDKIVKFSELGEEIAIKSSSNEAGTSELRRSVGCLWDAITTIKFLLEHLSGDAHPEESILLRRMEETLRVMGGARPTVTQDEIERLLKG